MLQVDTPVEDVVLVEDASSDDDDADSFASVVIEDPLLSAAVTDGSTLSTIEIKEEEPQPPDTSWLEATSPLATNDLKADDVRRPSVHHSPSMITTARCVRKSFDRSSLRRSTRLAQRKVLKDLGLIREDGKLDENAIQDCADCLKELVPPDLLQSIMHLKGRDFWDVVAGASLALR